MDWASLTTQNSPSYQQTGKIDYCIDTNGGNSYTISPSFDFSGNDWSVSAWVLLDSGVSNQYRGFFSNRQSGSGWVTLGTDNDGSIGCEQNGGTYNLFNSGITASGSGWHHLVFTYDATANESKFYIDNVLKKTLAQTSLGTSSQYIHCKWGDAGQYSWDGKIDEMSIWNEVLTSSKVSTIYNSGTGITLDTAKGATWTRQPPSFTASFWGAGGTQGPWTPVNYHDEFNGSTWSTATALGTSVEMVSGCGTKTAGLVIGGDTLDTANPISTVQAWNGSAWSTATGGTMNVARNQHAAGGSSISAWAVAGRTGGGANNTTSFWDNSSWTSGATTSTIRRNHAGAGAIDDCWITGGYDDTNVLASTEQYNGTAWSAGGNLGTATNSIMGGGGDSYNAIITGGNEGSNSNKTNIYDGTAWSLGGTLSNAHKYGITSGTPQDAGAYLGYITTWTPTWSETYNGTSWTTQGNISTGRATGAGGN